METMEVLPRHADGSHVMRMVTLPYPKFLHLESVPWKPWVMPGTEYKLLSVNSWTNGFTLLLKVAPKEKAPVHHHLGSIELFVLEGDLYYEKANVGQPISYLCEPAGHIHTPQSDSGCVLLIIFYGPIAGLSEEGSIIGVVDGETMLKLAREQGVADHVVGGAPSFSS